MIDDLGRDPLVSSLLILYGIHPEELQTRVERKLQEIGSKLHKMGAEATLIGVDDGGVRVRVRVDGHACGSTSRTVQGTVEEAIYEAAPDLKTLVIEGLEEPAASGFIAVETLLEASAALAATRSPLSSQPQSAVRGWIDDTGLWLRVMHENRPDSGCVGRFREPAPVRAQAAAASRAV